MKAYNPKDWYKILFFIQKADTIVRLFPFLIFIALYSMGIAYVEIYWLKLDDESWMSSFPVMHSLLGFVLSLLLVFRTNTAYDRWWEGRKLWGSLVNNSRNFAMKINAMLDENDFENKLFFKETIPLYAFALKDHLQSESTRLSLDHLDHPELDKIDHEKHVPNQIASLMISKTQDLYREGKITGDQLIVLNGEVSSFTDICGACERIKNTPIPFSYSSFIKKFILIYVLTLPFGYVFQLGYWIAPIITFVFYVLASLELIAEEIEEPFGHDQNDLPMDKMAINIKRHVGELL
ncbi:MAG TPA: bestrophin family ion channel [Arachidicoccus sp.]